MPRVCCAGKLTPADAVFLASDLLTRPIRHLHISEHSLGSSGGVTLATSLRMTTDGLQTKIKTLDASLNGLGKEGGARPSPLAPHAHSPCRCPLPISRLTTSCLPIGEAIAHALTTRSPTLTSLSLAFNRIGPSGAIAFAAMLKVNGTLTVLNLEGSSLTDGHSPPRIDCYAFLQAFAVRDSEGLLG